MSIPKPGRRVRGSRTGRPLMAVLDLLGRRWTLRIIWELRDEPLTFRELQRCCDEVSPTVLNQRLAELREIGIVDRHPERGYQLTGEGKQLLASLTPLSEWAERWAQREKWRRLNKLREKG
jgi:DNA-binding HxlR family transcriptional regulator